MKRRLLTGLSLTLIGSLAVVWVQSQRMESNEYAPREVNSRDAQGAQEYLMGMRANQISGEVDPQDVLNARQQAKALAQKTSSVALSWEELGPFNYGGRTRDLLIDRNDSNTLWAGSVAGGLFKSSNLGLSWAAVTLPSDANRTITGLAQTTDGDIFYGTGEGIYSFSSGIGTATSTTFMGGGIYRSTDGGVTFSVLPATVPTPNNPSQTWAHISDVEASPSDANRVYAGTANGLMVSNDGGDTWNSATSFSSTVTDFEVASDGSVWANIGGRTYYSPSGDVNSYTEISSSLGGVTDLPRSVGRQAYGVSHEDPDYVYVCQIAGDGGLAAVYRSVDRGATWSQIGQRTTLFDPFYNGSTRQGYYDLLIGVDPFDKDKLFIGGIDLWIWNGSWTRKSQWNAPEFLPFYVHADHHRIIFDPNVQGRAYHVSDGGVALTQDGGDSWTQRNKGYSTIQFYNMGIGPDDELIGGAQDNGTLFLKVGERSSGVAGESVEVFGGDGGYAEISKIQGRVYFAETPNGNLYRSGLRGDGWEDFYEQRMTTVRKPGDNNFALWVMPYVLHESFEDTASTDSITWGAFRESQFVSFGNGVRRSYSGTLVRPQESTKWLADSFKVVSGPLLIEWNPDSMKYVTDDGEATFDAATGDFTVLFSEDKNPPVVEISALADCYYNMGDKIELESGLGEYTIRYDLPSAVGPRDTIPFQDPVTQGFFVGLTSYNNSGGGIWLTRNPNNIGKASAWWQIARLDNGDTPQSMTASQDGNYLWVGTTNGNLYRLSNILKARNGFADLDTSSAPVVVVDKVRSFGGRNITSISINPNNPDQVVATLGNYGNNQYVYYSSNATQSGAIFNSVQGNLPAMPVYSSVINYFDGNQVIIGTELGIYSTDNILASSPSWVVSGTNMDQVPVFTLKQQINTKPSDGYIDNGNAVITDSVYNGMLYAGTYGRGFWGSTSLRQVNTIGVDENGTLEAKTKKESLTIFPNPATIGTNVEVELYNRGDVTVTILDLNGRRVAQQTSENLTAGKHNIAVDLFNVTSGTYIVTTNANQTVKTGKLVVVK